MHASEHHPKDFIGTGKFNNMHDMFSTKICHAVFIHAQSVLPPDGGQIKWMQGQKYNLGMFPILQFLEAKDLFNLCGIIIIRMT